MLPMGVYAKGLVVLYRIVSAVCLDAREVAICNQTYSVG